RMPLATVHRHLRRSPVDFRPEQWTPKMAAEIIQLAERRGQTEADELRQQRDARREFHEAFRFEMRAAFERVQRRRLCVMDHLGYDEFELWIADRIMKRKRMHDVRQRMLNRQATTDAYIRSRAGEAMPVKDALRLLRLFDDRKLKEDQ